MICKNSIIAHHTVDAELVAEELGHLLSLVNVPDADGRRVAALAAHEVAPVVREAHGRDRLLRRIRDVALRKGKNP